VESTEGAAAVVWTVRAATAFYFLTYAFRVADRRGAARLLWTLGCAAYLGHVWAAFHFVHHWSHQAALADTARQTQELMGTAVASGLYFNYLFTLVWLGDVIAEWWNVSKPRWAAAAVHGFMAFMFVNGAIVFARGAIRWFSIAAAGGVFIAWLSTRRLHSRAQ